MTPPPPSGGGGGGALPTALGGGGSGGGGALPTALGGGVGGGELLVSSPRRLEAMYSATHLLPRSSSHLSPMYSALDARNVGNARAMLGSADIFSALRQCEVLTR